ncbi:MAG: hypothetical protein A2W91_16720 [Bacteroidetes bacterium GWF2_38_335]|nr:MAG: hypothetical protein A2W91_16720 [Bacteroidetes bacterium GWF2_38_335]OFY81329.1 MAG: hypothetical protein A2281_07695 [Bacteroidetes bacterium RIFOXYA12_FULL_38_20]HBS85451.1 hypothetical protein [Bacteroidales bacterium]
MNEKLHDMFNGSDCPPDKVKKDYLDGKLSAEMKRSFELHLAGCEMCSDEIEGMSVINDPARIASVVSEINAEIDHKTGEKKAKVFFLETRWRAVAAIVILIIVSAVVLMNISIEKDSKQIVSDNIEKHPAKKKIPPTSSDSLLDLQTKDQPTPEEKAIPDKQKEYKKTTVFSGSVGKNEEIAKTDRGGYFNRESASDETVTVTLDDVTVVETEADEDKGVFSDLLKSSEELSSRNDSKNEAEKKEVADFEVSESKVVLAERSEDSREKSKNNRKADKESQTRSLGKAESPASGEITVTGGLSVGAGDTQNGAAQMPVSTATVDNNALDGDLVTSEDKALEEYDGKKYRDAIASFGKVLKDKPGDQKAIFYSALSYLSLGDNDKTIELLSDIITDKNSPYYSQSRYYLALAYKQKGNLEKARQICNEIVDGDDAFKEKASEILLEINNQ